MLDFYCVHVNTLLFAAYAFGFYLQSAFDLIRSVFDFVCSVIVFVMYVFLVCSVVTNGPPYDHEAISPHPVDRYLTYHSTPLKMYHSNKSQCRLHKVTRSRS